ncbi:MAG: hypothetical protein AAF215_20805 [Cyanobacteria bacterium P01_A01_bin.123]
MPWTAAIFLSLTLVSWRFTQTHRNDVGRFLGNLSAVACLIVGLATSPILLKSLILIGVVLKPAISYNPSLD